MFYNLSSDEGRAYLTELLQVRSGDDPRLRENFKEIVTGLCCLIRVLNSSETAVNMFKYRALCKSVYLKIVETFPWATISQSMHRVKLVLVRVRALQMRASED